jgi:hypothetical protein
VAVTEHDRNRARKHLGYGQVQAAATFVLGVPAAVETAFMIEGAFDRILPSAESFFREVLDKLDETGRQIFESQSSIEAKKIGNIEINDKMFEQLVQRYQYWQGELANMLQVPPNPFDQRFRGYGGGAGINISVSN